MTPRDPSKRNNIIRSIRIGLDISAKSVAAGMGMSQQCYSNIERREREPNFANVRLFVRYLLKKKYPVDLRKIWD